MDKSVVKGGQLFSIVLVVIFSVLFIVTLIRKYDDKEEHGNIVVAFVLMILAWSLLYATQKSKTMAYIISHF